MLVLATTTLSIFGEIIYCKTTHTLERLPHPICNPPVKGVYIANDGGDGGVCESVYVYMCVFYIAIGLQPIVQ